MPAHAGRQPAPLPLAVLARYRVYRAVSTGPTRQSMVRGRLPPRPGMAVRTGSGQGNPRGVSSAHNAKSPRPSRHNPSANCPPALRLWAVSRHAVRSRRRRWPHSTGLGQHAVPEPSARWRSPRVQAERESVVSSPRLTLHLADAEPNWHGPATRSLSRLAYRCASKFLFPPLNPAART
jgi:hypothetical protein